MKKLSFVAALLFATVALSAKDDKSIVKTGYNIGPLPAVAFDADKGFQLGAILQLFNYGDGSNYPSYDSKLYLEASFFTKGSQLYQLRYDNKTLIPGIRWCSSLRISLDKAYDFYGFNGYESYFDYSRVAEGNGGNTFQFTPFYRMNRQEYLAKSDFLGTITDHLQWEGGLFLNYYKTGEIDYANINKGKKDSQIYPETMPTLLSLYRDAGVISEDEFAGGFSGGIRAGLVYDSRDKEGAPSSGIWAEGHITASPKFLSKVPFYRYSLTWRHYLPIVDENVLTFAYRLNYEGSFGKNDPYYAISYMTSMGEKPDFEGMGGYNTVRGIMRTRAYGLDMATYNAELRWRFVKFIIGRQNICLALNAFSDGTMVTRGRDLSALKGWVGTPVALLGQDKDTPHITFGGGFRFIMNENFIVAAEYGLPVTHLMKNSPLYNQDGTGAFYVNIGYLF